MSEETMSNVAAIRKYFGNVSMQELKELKPEDRAELGELARKELSKQESN